MLLILRLRSQKLFLLPASRAAVRAGLGSRHLVSGRAADVPADLLVLWFVLRWAVFVSILRLSSQLMTAVRIPRRWNLAVSRLISSCSTTLLYCGAVHTKRVRVSDESIDSARQVVTVLPLSADTSPSLARHAQQPPGNRGQLFRQTVDRQLLHITPSI